VLMPLLFTFPLPEQPKCSGFIRVISVRLGLALFWARTRKEQAGVRQT